MNMEAVKAMRKSMNSYRGGSSVSVIINNNAIIHLGRNSGRTRTNALRAVERWQKMGKEVKLLCP